MIVALDANCLVKWAAQSKSDDIARLDELLRSVAAKNGKIVIPMPCFAEYLVGTDEATAAWISALERRKSVALAPFDRRAAFECALLDRRALSAGDKRGGRQDPWQKIKIDRQVIAIARVQRADELISDDAGLRSTALATGMAVRAIAELDLPDSARQTSLDLPELGSVASDGRT